MAVLLAVLKLTVTVLALTALSVTVKVIGPAFSATEGGLSMASDGNCANAALAPNISARRTSANRSVYLNDCVLIVSPCLSSALLVDAPRRLERGIVGLVVGRCAVYEGAAAGHGDRHRVVGE